MDLKTLIEELTKIYTNWGIIMSEEKLRNILEQLFNQEMSVEEAFDEISPEITFEEPYEGE